MSLNTGALTCLIDVPHAKLDGVELCLDVLGPSPLPTSPTPVVIRIGGCGAWRSGSRSESMSPAANPLFAASGFMTIGISTRHSYRAVFPAQLEDVRAAVRWIRSNPLGLPFDPSRIGSWGHSAGGHLSALTALSASEAPGTALQAVVNVSGPTDLVREGGDMHNRRPSPVTELVGGQIDTHREQLRLASPITYVNADAPPILTIHGTADETIPFSQAVLLHEALLAVGGKSTLTPIDGVFHNLQTDPDAPTVEQPWLEVAGMALEFFREHLGNPEHAHDFAD